MRARYDRYEMEILISLSFLILFLISTNFVSGFSFNKAVKGHERQFGSTVKMSANLIQQSLENDIDLWTRSEMLLKSRVKELALKTGIDLISVIDLQGQTIAEFKSSSRAGQDTFIISNLTFATNFLILFIA